MSTPTTAPLTGAWAGLIGQADAIEPLRQAAADAGRGTHAWLITGPPGSGRSNAARSFAAALQCRQEPPGCGECQDCTTALAGTHADVRIVATEKVGFTIDEIRELVMEAQRAPATGRWHIIIIEDADRMGIRTANVLLKAIEEPPEQTVWLLCAPNQVDVPLTIRSRCRPVALVTPPLDEVVALLESEGVEPRLAQVAAHAAQGHIGMARRLARSETMRTVRTELIDQVAAMRTVGDAVLAARDLNESAIAMAEQLAAEQGAAERAELLRSLGVDPDGKIPPSVRSQIREFDDDLKRRATRAQRDVLDTAMMDIASFLRDVLVVQLNGQVPLVNLASAGVIERLAGDTTPEHTLACLDAVSEARVRLAGNVSQLLVLEAMMIALRPRRR